MINSESLVNYFKETISDPTDRDRLFSLLYEITKDKVYFSGDIGVYIPLEKDIDREEWDLLMERLRVQYLQTDDDNKFWVYQAYLIAMLYSRTPLNLTDLAKIIVYKDGEQIDRDNNHVYNPTNGLLSFCKNKRGIGTEYYIPDDIRLNVVEWLTVYNKTDCFIVTRRRKRPTDIRNYISKQIFVEFNFPKIK